MEINEVPGGIRLGIKVQPRSSRNEIVGVQGGCLRIKLTAPPVGGEANRALITLLAKEFATARSNIELVRGSSSRNKLVEIKGINREQALARIHRC